MAAATCLSDLSDDLLRRILFFTPAFEGAATAVLARRWRKLWLSSGAINLHWRCEDDGKDRRDFFRRAESAFAAVQAEGTVVRRLTIHVTVDRKHQTFSLPRHHGESYVIDGMVSNHVLRRVDEVSVMVHISGDTGMTDLGGIYERSSNGALPSVTLRSLHITNCSKVGLGGPPGVTFPCLASLSLQCCNIWFDHLQGMIDTAPRLATLHLERCFLTTEIELKNWRGTTTHSGALTTREGRGHYQLRCLAVTDLVLANCNLLGGMELEVPSLQYFRYVGFIGLVSVKSAGSANLTRADLHFIDEYCGAYDKMGNKMCVSFWKFLQSFVDAQVLKVKLDYPIEHIAVVEENDLNELLGSQLLRNLERLEVEAWHHTPSGNATAVAMVNLLQCFPGVRDIHLRLKTKTSRMPVIAFYEDDDDEYEVSDIPELSKCSFNCLQSSLRRVCLQFQLQYVNCFQVQLAKFLAENALVLEEMHIEDPNYKNHSLFILCVHLHAKHKHVISLAGSFVHCSFSACILHPPLVHPAMPVTGGRGQYPVPRSSLPYSSTASSVPTHNGTTPTIQRIKTSLRGILVSDAPTGTNIATPLAVAIGPYHHDMPELRAMEEAKRAALEELCRVVNEPLRAIEEKIFPVALTARRYYADDYTLDGDQYGFGRGSIGVQIVRHSMDGGGGGARYIHPNNDHHDWKFARMMLLDGCFLLQFMVSMCSDNPNDPLMSRHEVHTCVDAIARDVMLLENQIPWVVLETLTKLRPDPGVPVDRFLARMASAFVIGNDSDGAEQPTRHHANEQPPPHLLSLFYRRQVGAARIESLHGSMS
ncbi:hypothetical protein HU200_044026 [Digitaria exilis]|uniref:F-box/LRR-repeat protein 15/At3g58940/PEG3-like LRR domain-containing protein n=1 Tax=Digitaria exilis TaxID=1010633 RepID=A0A835B360_9POAL|nr:hypothetical protein HU200_044026 [Digitaria exilis]